MSNEFKYTKATMRVHPSTMTNQQLYLLGLRYGVNLSSYAKKQPTAQEVMNKIKRGY